MFSTLLKIPSDNLVVFLLYTDFYSFYTFIK